MPLAFFFAGLLREQQGTEQQGTDHGFSRASVLVENRGLSPVVAARYDRLRDEVTDHA
jgi:hypothetical protein